MKKCWCEMHQFELTDPVVSMFILSTKFKGQRVLQPNFLHGNAIFGHMGSFKGAAQKHQIMNY